MHMKTGAEGGKLNYLLGLPSVPGVLIMGSSRANHHVDPEAFLTPTFNLAEDGRGIAYNTSVLKILEANKTLSDTIILHIDKKNFQHHKVMGDYKGLDIKALSFFYSREKSVTNYINAFSFSERVKYFFKLFRHNGRVAIIFENFIESKMRGDFKDNGYRPIEKKKRIV
ncbi:MAG: hypothetical protein HQK83_08105 [Fibrobacteria bacterium]|nr:hypothetical protein [Fibrobacteria bacterium]